MSSPAFRDSSAVAAIIILDYLLSLFTDSPREHYDRDSILVLLNCVKNDPALIDPAAVITCQEIFDARPNEDA